MRTYVGFKKPRSILLMLFLLQLRCPKISRFFLEIVTMCEINNLILQNLLKCPRSFLNSVKYKHCFYRRFYQDRIKGLKLWHFGKLNSTYYGSRSRRDAAVYETTLNLVYCGISPTAAATVDKIVSQTTKHTHTVCLVVLSTAASRLLRLPK